MKAHRVRLAVFALLMMAAVPVDAQFTPPAGSPLALNQRPRIWITPNDIPSVKSRIASGGAFHGDFQTWVTWLDSKYNTGFTIPTVESHAWPTALAFAYLTHPVTGITYARSQADYGTKAREALMALVNSQNALNARVPDIWGFQVIVAYDWIHPLLSAADRAACATYFKKLLPNQFAWNDSVAPFQSQAHADRAILLLSAIALWGDVTEDAWAGTELLKYNDYYRGPRGTTRSESELGGNDGWAGQGFNYALAYAMQSTLGAEEAYRTAMGIPLSTHYSGSDALWLRRIPQFLSYLILPTPFDPAVNNAYPGGYRYLYAKLHKENGVGYVFQSSYTIPAQFVLGGLRKIMRSVDPAMADLANWFLVNRNGQQASDQAHLFSWPFGKFINGDLPAQTKSPAQLNLPLSREFKAGWFVFRTGWQSSTDSMVTFHANKWMWSSSGHSPFAGVGTFEINRKGPQVIRQGYIGHDWSSHDAGPGNMLIFPDTSITAKTGTWDEEGGHRKVLGTNGQMRGFLDMVDDSPFEERDWSRFFAAKTSAGRDVDYAAADVTRAYNSTLYKDAYNPARVSQVIRHFVYFRAANQGTDSDRVVVFDRATTTDVKFQKRWLFHTAGVPVIDGAETAGQPVRGTGEGKSTYTGATLVTATNTVNGSNGKVWLTPLLPAARTIVKVGGPGPTGSWKTSSHEYESPYGVQGEVWGVPTATEEPYVGAYRVEIIPSVASLADLFLNVVEVTDANGSKAATALLNGTNMTGARVGNRIAVFNTVSDSLASGDITIDAAGTYRIHFAGLTPAAQYQVTVGGAAAVMLYASPAGTMYIERTVAASTAISLNATGVIASPPSKPAGVKVVP